MGGNGSFSRGMYDKESERDYKTAYSLSKNIKVIELKNPGSHNTMPRTSHTANRVYVTMKKDGSGVREVTRYGKDHKARWSIHTEEHKEGKERWKNGHVHFYKNGGHHGRPHKLSDHPRLQRLLDKIRKMERDRS